jgi:hypothetical protein
VDPPIMLSSFTSMQQLHAAETYNKYTGNSHTAAFLIIVDFILFIDT